MRRACTVCGDVADVEVDCRGVVENEGYPVAARDPASSQASGDRVRTPFPLGKRDVVANTSFPCRTGTSVYLEHVSPQIARRVESWRGVP